MQGHRQKDSCRVHSAGEENQLVDNFGRKITYLRLAITDRCDLRCRYCCPEGGVQLVPHDQILSYEELERLVRIFASFGVGKIRLTGGEPFARKGLLSFMRMVKKIPGVHSLYLTTNGVQASKHLDALASAGVDGINLSLDTLDRKRYQEMTMRDRLEEALQTFHGAIERKIPLKVNSVVLEDTSDSDLLSIVGLSKDYPVTVRFIEEMPFSGADKIGKHDNGSLFDRLQALLPSLTEEEQSGPSTAKLFALPGYRGKIGIIAGKSRHFCKTCNKVRITPTGMLKTCLYDNGVLDLRELLRSGDGDAEIAAKIGASIKKSAEDGHAAEKKSCRTSEPSMAKIGG